MNYPVYYSSCSILMEHPVCYFSCSIFMKHPVYYDSYSKFMKQSVYYGYYSIFDEQSWREPLSVFLPEPGLSQSSRGGGDGENTRWRGGDEERKGDGKGEVGGGTVKG